MGKALILAEKPSVAREIANVMNCRQKGNGFISGSNYIVTWALGHLVTLADPETYGEQYKSWNIESLPMLPKKMELTVIRETTKQYKIVRDLLRRSEVSEIIIATDSGREGELVARWILMKSGCRKPCKRLWISSQTAKAIKEGFAKLRPGREYDNLFHSAVARAEADWLVGLNVTRALTCKHNAQLSAGRVQTPTLALIVKREEEIQKFVPKEYFTVRAQLSGFSALWMDERKNARIFQEEKARQLTENLKGKPAVITQMRKQFRQTPPPAAYDLTELQRDANKRFAYSAKETLSIMQALYERHKVLTYPRTDSRYISDDIVPTLPDRLKAVAIGKYSALASKIMRSRPIPTRHIVNNAKVTDHHAIIPTEEPVNLMALSPEERNIFDLVVRRFLAVLLPPYEYEETTLTVQIGKENFYAKGKIPKNAGWKEAYGEMTEDSDEEEGDMRGQILPQLRQGERVTVQSLKKESGKTAPPKRYTEATLLSAMEHPGGKLEDKALRSVLENTSGLGTPATRADIIEKLFSSFYIERKGREICPTSKGKQLVSIVPEDLKSAELTAKWEQKLMQISKGTVKSGDFIGEMRTYASKLTSNVIASNAKYVHDNMTRQKCPDCGKFLLDVKGKRGKMLVCSDRECGYRQSVSMETNARCPNCHKKMELRGEGEKKLFTCICGHRERMADFEKRKASNSGVGKRDVQNYLKNQNQTQKNAGNSALAEQLAKWKEQNK
jgi:DNA topoisomerase III, bacteria and conjugative plasmid